MSDKKRRDITLGEMQDECKKYWNNGNLGSCGKCQYMSICCHYEDYAPAKLNLTDPPRFNEAQMALLRGLYENGVTKLKSDGGISSLFKADHEYIGNFINSYMGIEISVDETLDLAELLGKDGADAD